MAKSDDALTDAEIARLLTLDYPEQAPLGISETMELLASLEEKSDSSANPVKVHEWRALGHRWALAKDKDGNALGIYDLSMLSMTQVFTQSRLLVGSIGSKRATLSSYLNTVWQSLSGSRPNYVTRKALGIMKNYSENENGGIASIERKYGIQWWKQIVWNDSKKFQTAEEGPKSFKLADMNLPAMVPRRYQKLFEKRWHELNNVTLDQIGDELTGQEILKGLHFSRNEAGEIDAYFQPDVKKENNIRPPVLVDFNNPLFGMKAAMKIMLVEQSLKQLVQLFSVPVLNNILRVVIDRFFDHYKGMRDNHYGALVEMVYLSTENPDHFMNQFSYAQKIQIYKSVQLSKFSLSSFWKMIKNSPEKSWIRNLEKLHTMAAINKARLERLGVQQRDLAPWFTQAYEAEQPLAIYATGKKPKYSFQGVPKALNYINPYGVIFTRKLVELIEDALIFITPPFPYADKVIRYIYKWAVLKEVNAIRNEEARLLHNLKYRSTVFGEDWNYEISILRLTNYNAFELSEISEARLIERRKKELDI